MKAIVFLGGGRITSALVAGLRLSCYRASIVVHDRHPDKLRALKRQHRIVAEPDLQRALRQADLLVIAVRPSGVAQLLRDIGQIDQPVVAISLAAGIPLRNLQRQIRAPVQWARAMPSPACRTQRGLTAVTFPRGLPAAARDEVRALFARVGDVREIPESRLDAFTVTYSTSHGYHALATLAGAAERVGLDRKSALIAAAHGLADGILLWRDGNISVQELVHEAATPGGIAATVMEAMDKAGYAGMVERALRAGLARAKANAKG
ncbi:MAG TPA: NAD(P)-binding domain-containing protein [Terriglobales bacterium]|nr:NAD(P)-binding domain-containing protein [Terriglobales bacterium]